MVKEEIHLRKDVIEEEVVEENVRRKVVDVDDQTTRRGSLERNRGTDDTRRRNR